MPHGINAHFGNHGLIVTRLQSQGDTFSEDFQTPHTKDQLAMQLQRNDMRDFGDDFCFGLVPEAASYIW